MLGAQGIYTMNSCQKLNADLIEAGLTQVRLGRPHFEGSLEECQSIINSLSKITCDGEETFNTVDDSVYDRDGNVVGHEITAFIFDKESKTLTMKLMGV